MPASLEFLRGVLGVLCVMFAHMAGRSGAAVRKGRVKISRLYAWILRAAVCAIGVGIRHSIDVIDIGVWVLGVAAFAIGWWDAARQKEPEDLTHQIFPE